jgi:hypothetical protein
LLEKTSGSQLDLRKIMRENKLEENGGRQDMPMDARDSADSACCGDLLSQIGFYSS